MIFLSVREIGKNLQSVPKGGTMSRLLLIALTLAGCSVSAEEQAQIDKVCAKVTDENWSSPPSSHGWTNRPAKQVCQEAVNVSNGEIPCTFGGLKGWCLERENGSVSYHRGISPCWTDIDASERSLVDPHLIIHK
jgi:hypothetical protein